MNQPDEILTDEEILEAQAQPADADEAAHAQAAIALEKSEKAGRERAARLASNTAALKPGDVSGETYSAERRREYTEKMGEFAVELREQQGDPARLAPFLSELAEQERRWLGRRLGRSVSLAAARETLAARLFENVASRVQWPVRAHGYAARPKHAPTARANVLILNDLHIGAKLPVNENPEAFDFTAAGRRLASLAHETAEFKTQYRDKTQLHLGLNGDIIEGLLEHNDEDNFPFAEQMTAAVQFLTSVVEYLAAAYPSVIVDCQTGNHGRIKSIHYGRATSSKANSYETIIYRQIEAQCRRALPNVEFRIPKAPWSTIPILGNSLLMFHGDTEPGVKSPSSSGGAAVNTAVLSKLQAEGTYGKDIGAMVFGHFHEADARPTSTGWIIAQGMLVPANGYARAGRQSGVCGFYLWESTPNYLIGDTRFLRVGPKHDGDRSLDDIVPEFNPWGTP